MKVVLDIETCQMPMEEWARLKGSNAQEFNPDIEPDKAEKEYEKSKFDGTFGRIVCIGVFILDKNDSLVDSIVWYGSNESAILEGFWSEISLIRPHLIITHNGLNFDLPFIKKRSIIHQIKPPLELSLAKFRSSPIYDTMAIWANWDPRYFIKLDVLARVLDVETKTGSGDQVAQMWEKKQYEAIAKYCLNDVYVTYACYRRMNFSNPANSALMLTNSSLRRFDLMEEIKSLSTGVELQTY